MTFQKADFSAEIISAAKAHAVSCYPNESCGLVVSGAYVPCENTATDPTNNFKIDAEKVVDAGENLEAVIHSHPDGVAWPRKADMQSQIDTGVIFGVIPCNKLEAFDPVFWGDYRLEEPLIGRSFVPGVSDCYSLIRAYYWQVKGIKLPDFARDEEWWNQGEDIYRANFSAAGFSIIDAADAKSGDVFLGMVNSSVPNHGGILFDDRGLGLHHLANRLSRRESILPWRRFITLWLRYSKTAE
jgi:proteasome lid subunit RPN8/RPN11